MPFNMNRFYLIVTATWLPVIFLNSQLLFAIFSNYSPKWKCGSDAEATKSCKVFNECRENLTFYDDHFQSAALEFGWICSEHTYLASAFSQLQFFGVLIGNLVYGTLSDLYGRKPCALLAVSFGCVATFMSGFAPSWQVLHLLRFILGLSIGGTHVTIGVLITELILPEQRMVLRGCFNWGFARLILTAVCFAFPDWRSASIACSILVLPAILSIIFIFPESPTWLHNKGRLDEMREAEQYIANFAGKKYEPVEHRDIERVKTICDMWRTPGLFRRLVVLWPMFFVAALSAYTNDLNSNTIYGNLFVNQMLYGLLIAISKLILLMADTWFPALSRRLLHQGSQSVVCICFLTLTIFTVQRYEGVGVLIVNLMGCVFIEYTWDACYLCVVESLETSCRSSGTASCSLIARFGALSSPFLTYMNTLWPPSVYCTVFVLGTMNLIISNRFLIETKGVDLDAVTNDIRSLDEPEEMKNLRNAYNQSDQETTTRHPLLNARTPSGNSHLIEGKL